jgi:uncharacterized lipoprotein YajG
MKKALFSLAALALLTGCASAHQCIQPDPVQPSYSNDNTLKPTAK